MKEIHEERGGLFGAGYDLTEIKVNWISSDVPNAAELKEQLRGLHDRRDRGPRGQARDRRHARRRRGRRSSRSASPRPMLMTPPESMKEIANVPGRAPGRERRRRPHEVRHHRPLRHRAARPTGCASTRSCRSRRRIGACRITRPWPPASRAAASSPRARRPTSIVYDPDTVDSLAQERSVRLPGGRVAAHPEGRRLRADHRQRQDDLHRRRVHRAPRPASCCATARTEGADDDRGATERSRRSSTPTTTTGSPATPSPATATRSSPTEACV